jgi:aspartate racemase
MKGQKKTGERRIVGVVGGVGPFAGLDLNRKIFENTRTCREQDHLEVYLLSASSRISDRTEYLLNPQTVENPGEAIYGVIEKLHRIGARVIGIPCNTSHCAPIFDLVLRRIEENGLDVTLLNMIEETRDFVRSTYPEMTRVGLLATKGTYGSDVYGAIFRADGKVKVLAPTLADQDRVHASIYDPEYGIKNHPDPVRPEALQALTSIAVRLIADGAEAIIMGCTEIPLALESVKLSVPLIDATEVLARALIARVDRDALK